MCKKLALTGVAAAIAAFILFGSSAFTHISQGVGWVRGQVEESVPLEYQLEKARKAIKTAEPKIRQYNRDIAEKQVEIRYLEREITQLEQKTAMARSTLQEQYKLLQVEQASYSFHNHTISKAHMRKDAENRLKRLKAADAMVVSKNERLAALKSGLAHIHQALANLTQTRSELITQCDVLEAKMRETEAKKASTLDIEVDHSDMAKAAEILRNVEKKLDVEMQVMENNAPLLGDKTFTLDTPIDLNEQIGAYLSGETDKPVLTEAECNTRSCEATGSLVDVR